MTAALVDAPSADRPPREGASGRPARRWRQEQSPWTALLMSVPFIVVALAFIVYPFIRLVITAFSGPMGWGIFNVYFHNQANLRTLRVTFGDAAIVTVITVCIGALLAWSLRTTRHRGMQLLILSAVFIPFWMGSVTKLYALTVILERLGIVNRTLMNIGLIDQPLDLMYNQTAVIIGMVVQMTPFAVLPLYVGFLSIDLDLIRAAESLGASRISALRSVVVPLALPATFASVTIVYVVSIGFYLTPILLGGSAAPFSATLISQNIFDFYDVPGASVSAILLLACGLAVLLLAYLVVGKERLRKALG